MSKVTTVSPETFEIAMRRLNSLQEEIDRLKAPQILSKVERDFSVVTRDWVNEWLATPVVKTEFIYLGCNAFSIDLQHDTKRWIPEINKTETVFGCYVEFTQYLGPIPESLRWEDKKMGRLRRFSWSDLATHPQIEVTEDDIAEFNLPEDTQPRAGEHKLRHMFNRMMLRYREAPELVMPLERFKIKAQIEFQAEWMKEDQIAANHALLAAYDQKQLITGKLDTGEFSRQIEKQVKQKEDILAGV